MVRCSVWTIWTDPLGLSGIAENDSLPVVLGVITCAGIVTLSEKTWDVVGPCDQAVVGRRVKVQRMSRTKFLVMFSVTRQPCSSGLDEV